MVKFTFAVLIGVAAACWVLNSGAGAFSKKESKVEQRSMQGESSSTAGIWITHPDGAQSCSPNSGQSLEDGAAELKKAHVRVLDSRKGSDGKMHMQMCGAPTGTTNAYLIPREDLPQAATRGYVEAH